MNAEQVYKESTKRADKLLEWAKKNSSKFLTGEPKSVYRYGVGEDNKVTFVTFLTERGTEELYTGSDCLAVSIADSVKIVHITGKK